MEFGPDLEPFMQDATEPAPAILRYMEQYIVEDINGVKIVLRKDSVRAAYDSIDPAELDDEGRVTSEVADILAEGSIKPFLN
jgi:hypothetical protein